MEQKDNLVYVAKNDRNAFVRFIAFEELYPSGCLDDKDTDEIITVYGCEKFCLCIKNEFDGWNESNYDTKDVAYYKGEKIATV